jgi:hypothetical protein
MGQNMRFQETLRRLATIDEGFVEDRSRLGLDPATTSALRPKTAAGPYTMGEGLAAHAEHLGLTTSRRRS